MKTTFLIITLASLASIAWKSQQVYRDLNKNGRKDVYEDQYSTDR